MCQTKPQIYILSILFFFSCTVLAQEVPEFKFGKISKEDIQNNTCDIDSSAHAFFLFDQGVSTIDYTPSVGFQIKFNRHCAIKILTKSGYDYANFKIPVYEATSGRMEEDVTKIKAVTYNLENGKIKETDINKKDIFTEKEDENWSNVSFTLPNVIEGSVIEVEYSITSDFLWNLPTWRFQYDIPSKWSTLRTEIPEYFFYNREMRGYVGLFSNEQSTTERQITFTNISRTSGSLYTAARSNVQTSQVRYRLDQEVYVAKDIPAFKSEAYIDAEQNYMSAIFFELQSTKFPNDPIKTYTTTWEEICKSLMDDEDFGRQLKAVNPAKDVITGLNLDGLTEQEKSIKIFDYVKNATKWNKQYSKYCNNVKQVIKEGVGNVGEINMMLINLLDAADIEVYPVVLKTRYAGKLPFYRPSLSSLNYLIAAVKMDDKTYLLDASEKEIPYGMLPKRCINDKGILLHENGSFEWIDLNAKSHSRYTIYGEIDILDGGELNAKINSRHYGYFALDKRQKLDPEEDKNIENFEKEHTGFLVENYEIENKEQYDTYLQEKIEGTISNKIIAAGDMMYLNPCLFERFEENPFKIEERKYPVDFTYPLINKIIFSFTIPQDWKVESIPESITYSLPDNAGKFIYNIQQMENKIVFNQSLTITKSLFLPDEYTGLKEFFRLMVDKQNEQIVLKKI